MKINKLMFTKEEFEVLEDILNKELLDAYFYQISEEYIVKIINIMKKLGLKIEISQNESKGE